MAEVLRTPAAATTEKTLALVGQPNVGKSLIFSHLTGRYTVCSNYPGTTVELFRGTARIGRGAWSVLDTPGILSLTASSEAEVATRELLIFGGLDAVLQVADAKNPERALMMTLQLAELGLPLILNLNMADERRACGLALLAEKLTRQLGIPVVETVAITGEGLEDLCHALTRARTPELTVDYGSELEPSITEIEALIGDREVGGTAPLDVRTEASCHGGRGERLSVHRVTRLRARGLATLLLALHPKSAHDVLQRLEPSPDRRDEIALRLNEARARNPQISYDMALARRRAVDRLLQEVSSDEGGRGDADASVPTPGATRWGERLGRWTTHPLWGMLILLGVLYAIYQLVGVVGAQVMVDWLEETLFGEHINPALVRFFERYAPIPLVQDLFVGQYGIFTMALTYSIAIILPIVTTFFLAFGFLEDSGYFARLAVMAHRLFRKMGLSGQAVLPMILGLGCDTMATVTTRALETHKERVIATLLLALGVPCSAQMAVLLAMSAAVSPWVLAGVLGIVGLQILIVGRLAAHLLSGESAPFIIELPPLRRPQPGNIAAKTRMRLVWYVTEVVPLFVLGTLVLFVLDKVGILAAFQATVRPVVEGLLGLPGQAAQAFIMGFFRRDYGAAGLYQLQQAGALDIVQVLVSLVVITLFVPCIANFLVIVKERGWRTALGIATFILPYAVLVGALVNAIARTVVGGG